MINPKALSMHLNDPTRYAANWSISQACPTFMSKIMQGLFKLHKS